MKYLILTIITLFLFSCKSKKGTTDGNDSKSATSETLKEVIIDPEFIQPKDNVDFQITEVSIDEDILTMTVSYSGGCEDHEFNAYFNQVYMKSEPPKAGIFIEHISNDDMCKKLVTEKISFSLKNLRVPGKDGDYTVMVGMNNYKGWLEYSY